MIVTGHVTGCLAERPPAGGSAEPQGQRGGAWGGRRRKALEFYLLGVLSDSSIINFQKDLSWRGTEKITSLCPTNLGHGSYEWGEKWNQRPKEGTPELLSCLFQLLTDDDRVLVLQGEDDGTVTSCVRSYVLGSGSTLGLPSLRQCHCLTFGDSNWSPTVCHVLISLWVSMQWMLAALETKRSCHLCLKNADMRIKLKHLLKMT